MVAFYIYPVQVMRALKQMYCSLIFRTLPTHLIPLPPYLPVSLEVGDYKWRPTVPFIIFTKPVQEAHFWLDVCLMLTPLLLPPPTLHKYLGAWILVENNFLLLHRKRE